MSEPPILSGVLLLFSLGEGLQGELGVSKVSGLGFKAAASNTARNTFEGENTESSGWEFLPAEEEDASIIVL